MKTDITRFGISMSSELLSKFDNLIESKGYTNRSEAIRDLIRDYLVEQEWQEDQETIGAVTIVYNHHVRELTESLTAIQHNYYNFIISSMHIHIDEHNCLETTIIRGR